MKYFSLFSLSTAAGAVFIILGTVLLPGAVKGQESEPKPPADSSIIRLPDKQVAEIKTAAEKAGLGIKRTFPLPDNETLVTFNGSPGKVKGALSPEGGASLSGMQTESLDISPNYKYQLTKTPNDSKYSEQWNMKKTDAPKGWDITTGSTDTIIAIVDSGVLFNQDPYHDHNDMVDSQRWENSDEVNGLNDTDDDLNGYTDDKYGWDFTGGYASGSDCPNDTDTTSSGDNGPQPYSCDNENDKSLLNKNDGDARYVGHGTVVGSIAAAKTNNNTLVAGTDWKAKIMNLRVFDGYGRATTARVVSAVEYATDNGADAINLSLAIYDDNGSCDIIDDKLEEALKEARNNGIITAAASGNNGDDHVCYPAASRHTLAVGASTVEDKRALFSNYGDQLDLIAPGKDVPALTAPSEANGNREYVGNASGTSLSTPHVTGTAALLKGMFPDATFNQIRTNLQKGVDKVSEMGSTRTKKHGFGRLNIHKANKHADSTHPDGTLISTVGNPRVFLLENGKRRYITDPAIFNSHNFQWKRIKRTTLPDANLNSGNSLPLREGTLVTPTNDTKIYIIDHDSGSVRKRHIGSPSVFHGLGFSNSEVMKVKPRVLPGEDGPAVSSADQHPDGVLISPDGKPQIYLVENSQRRYVKSPAVLKSHQFRGGVKEATKDDMNLGTGNSLDFREGTLVTDDDPPLYAVNYDSNGNIEKRHIKTLLIYRVLGLGSSRSFQVDTNDLPSQDGDPIN
ncbi:hypothetical protein BRC19_00820 [Candidatus Saccharibacteria bacterium QS_5_54_17]|nr:MAG: hypothetical protein BRC19_00820 [Candidatus Saccharibacteria bacterium QS_5_54_17]